MTNNRLVQVKSIAECSMGEHSAVLLTFIKLAFDIKIFVFCVRVVVYTAFIVFVDTLFVYLNATVLWSPAGKRLTSWLSSVVSNCEFVTFPLVSWVRCGT